MTGSSPLAFETAYPAPWRISGDDVIDADGDVVCTFEASDADEVVFWHGIVDAVNDRARLANAMRLARAL